MAGSRQSVQLTEAEIEDFLGSQMKVQVATVGPDGAPHLTTLFYVLTDGKIEFWTYGPSQKVRNLRRDPRVTCLVEDYDEIKAIGTRVMGRMSGGADLGELGDDLVSKQAHKRVGIVIEPEKIASWDHRKLGALPGQG